MGRRAEKVVAIIALPLLAKAARNLANACAADAEKKRKAMEKGLRPFDEKSRDRSLSPQSNWEPSWRANQKALAADRVASVFEEFVPSATTTTTDISSENLELLRRIDAGGHVTCLPDQLAHFALAVPRIERHNGHVFSCFALSAAGHQLLASLENREAADRA